MFNKLHDCQIERYNTIIHDTQGNFIGSLKGVAYNFNNYFSNIASNFNFWILMTPRKAFVTHHLLPAGSDETVDTNMINNFKK